jgi:hypothetical protein
LSQGFIKSHFTQILVGSGFAGFTVTLLLYFNVLELHKDTFHEITVNQNELIDSFNTKRVNSLRKNVDSLGVFMDRVKWRNVQGMSGDSSGRLVNLVDEDYFRQSKQLALSEDALRKYRPGKVVKFFESSQVDTFINDPVRISRLYTKGSTDSLDFLIVDTVNKNFPYHFKANIRLVSYPHNTDFFLKYPAFGIWALGVTALISVWFILLVIFFAGLYEFRLLIKDNAKESGIFLSRKRINSFLAYSVLLVFIFFAVGKITVYDKYNIIPEDIFILNYMVKFKFLLIAGLVIASLFFGGYLIMGDILKQCATQMDALERHSGKIVITPEEKTAKQDVINTICKAALNNLQKYFIITAASLTGVVVVTGILFTAVNNLDFSKVYFQSFQRNILSYDTVYLFGGLYSLLILLFYLPLKLTFARIKEKQPDTTLSITPQGGSTKFFSKDFWNRMKETFAVSSPLLASLIQWFIETFSK